VTSLGSSPMRLASWAGVAHPFWLVAAAAIAARTSLAAATSAGSVRLAVPVSSPKRLAKRLRQLGWLPASAPAAGAGRGR
jgi:hypothetical protein